MSNFPPPFPMPPSGDGQPPKPFNPLEALMNHGMPAGAFQHQQGGAYNPSLGMPEEAEIAQQLLGLRNPGQITDEEIEIAYQKLQQDPQAGARKDLMRLYLSEQRFVDDIAQIIGRQALTPKALGEYRKIQSEAIKNVQMLTDALGLQPKQSKDDGGGDDISSLSERYERWLKDREMARGPHSPGRPDPRGAYKTAEEIGFGVRDLVRERYNLEELIKEQFEKIDDLAQEDIK